MANYIAVPRDLTKVKSKVFFNLTKRQLICFSLAALIGVPSFFLLKKAGNTSVAAMGMMAVMMPLFFFAMYERNREPLEVILFHFIEARFIRPKIRIYQTDNYYAAMMRQEEAEREVEKLVHKYQVSLQEGGQKHVSHSGISEGRRLEAGRGDH